VDQYGISVNKMLCGDYAIGYDDRPLGGTSPARRLSRVVFNTTRKDPDILIVPIVTVFVPIVTKCT
jgi:hypothetical protein